MVALDVTAQVEFESNVCKRFIIIQLQALKPSAEYFNPGPTRGQPGGNLGSTWGQPGVNLGPTWGQPGVSLGST
jgi:hypothetical protein